MGEPMRILVVEDELKLAGLLRRGLAEEGYAADVARTGEDALWMARSVEYDAIVLDLMLPELDGFEVCRGYGKAACGHPCSCSPPGTPSRTASPGSMPARTTTCRSRSRSRSSLRGCGPSRGGAR